MLKKLNSDAKAVSANTPSGASYITQMLCQLATQAKQRDGELAYFIEMAATVSSDLDRKEARSQVRAAK